MVKCIRFFPVLCFVPTNVCGWLCSFYSSLQSTTIIFWLNCETQWKLQEWNYVIGLICQVESQKFPLISIHCSLKLIPLIRLLHFNYFSRRFLRWNLDDFQVSVLTDEESPFYVYHIEYDYKLPENAEKAQEYLKNTCPGKKLLQFLCLVTNAPRRIYVCENLFRSAIN